LKVTMTTPVREPPNLKPRAPHPAKRRASMAKIIQSRPRH
jgi:hypothetical protein